jgi:glycosyltransferase involved in cell wall biosynthesis
VLKFALQGAKQRYADGLVLASDVETVSGLGCEFMASSRRLPAQTPVPTSQSGTSRGYSVRFLGRWHPNKGVDLLLDALTLLSDSTWSRIREVVIAGGGVLEPEVRRAASALAGVGRPVRIEGYLGREAAAKFVAAADFLALPSRIESIPVILSDALHCKTTLVMTPVGDLPELHRRYGYGVMVDEVSAQAIARGLASAVVGSPAEFYGRGDELAHSLSLDASVRRFLGDISLELGFTPG